MGVGELSAMEQEAAVVGSSNKFGPYVLRLVDEVRRLQHELDDPRYKHNGVRVTRQDLLIQTAALKNKLTESR